MNEKQVGRFFESIPGVSGLYSYRLHGNMKFTLHKEGEANREFFRQRFLGSNSKLVLANVNHGVSVATIYAPRDGHWENVIETDALVAQRINDLYLAVTFADCPPVFLIDPIREIIGAVHGGWRPVMNNILYNTVNKMIVLGAKIERLKVAILPGICQECYQFSAGEARKIFRLYGSYVKYANKGKKCYVDLKGIIKFQLTQELGVPLKNLEISRDCTCCLTEKYFSYRGEKMKPDNIRAGIAMLGFVSE